MMEIEATLICHVLVLGEQSCCSSEVVTHNSFAERRQRREVYNKGTLDDTPTPFSLYSLVKSQDCNFQNVSNNWVYARTGNGTNRSCFGSLPMKQHHQNTHRWRSRHVSALAGPGRRNRSSVNDLIELESTTTEP